MPQPNDHSDGPSTLPTPELNPLQNPVLGRNMGRWAEVYFTSPPDKREQAVLELLRELRAENPELGSATGAASPAILQPDLQPLAEAYPHIAEAEQASVRCDVCGRENPASHKFCGMCGTLMAEPMADLHVSDLHISDLRVEDLPVGPAPVRRGPGMHGENELRIFRDAGEDKYRDDYKGGMFASSAPRPAYRVYIGIALAVVIFALAYVAWRNTQATSQSAYVAPQAAVATPPAAPAPTPSLSTDDAGVRATPSDAPSPGAPAQGAPSSGASAVGASAPSDRPAETAPPQGASTRSRASTVRHKPAPAEPPAASAAVAVAGNGAEELAVAQRYLDGTDGQARNRAEGAKWLWKAMGKHNARATLLLADLYLKGDGVSKNCDQARVLLDSATRGGMKEAGERLRHLQTFGCQ